MADIRIVTEIMNLKTNPFVCLKIHLQITRQIRGKVVVSLMWLMITCSSILGNRMYNIFEDDHDYHCCYCCYLIKVNS